MKEVRTRFAPSPTGYMHIGNLRTAIYEYLIAKSQGGKFLLRVEDTDQARFVEGAVEVILKTLNIVGLRYDEGPDIGGPYGPYVQSQRKAIYKEYANKLVELKGAYYCFCSKERTESLGNDSESTTVPAKHNCQCKNLSAQEVSEKFRNHESYVVRQWIPAEGSTEFHDLVYGTVSVENSELDEGVLLKSDGLPTYNFANVVDDHLMEITHVVRGSEYLSSTPKYNLLYKSFDWDIPEYIHLPPIMKTAEKKLSKREGDASFEDFVSQGYLPEAIVNYIVLLGWNPGTNEEFFSLQDLEKIFNIAGLSKSPAIFDVNKLKWMNGEYLRRLGLEEFNDLALPYYKGISDAEIELKKVSALLQKRIEILNEIPEKVDFLKNLPDYDISLFVHKKMKTDAVNSLSSLQAICEAMASLEPWDLEAIEETLTKVISQLGVKNGQVLWPLRTALSGKESSPGGGAELAELLGKRETLRRIEVGISKLKNTVQ
ncbi:glutamyl-tRNA synthetase [Desulfosporosinus acidiphilus SJ4]|uniref:Glutamate--tRNA ligase n=1 Tax=Desulfosporosinus acidiphilus (strain DSM 22704 / JCM 16185 / SJ4) TaxID=646529 RepID=I4D160_DESAJ|nr:glutamate--tRNA ligase [Desulfosporosinus acidiphilus]AFM39534.1 glutamyl-tRNA synthetase [Desulfosporosinus acidiphilus SJ4]